MILFGMRKNLPLQISIKGDYFISIKREILYGFTIPVTKFNKIVYLVLDQNRLDSGFGVSIKPKLDFFLFSTGYDMEFYSI